MLKIKLNKKTLPASLISLGLILFIIHNPHQPLLRWIFLPHIGFGLLVIGLVMWFSPQKKLDLGPKYIWIPMCIIVGSMIAQLAIRPSMDSVATGLFGIILFGLYIASRQIGKDVFKYFYIAVVIEAISVIIMGISGSKNGGLISPTNYDIATGFLVFGSIVSISKKQWLVVAIALVGLFFTGAEEAIVASIIIGATVLIRRDWNKKMLIPVGVVALALVVGLWSYTPILYRNTMSKLVSTFDTSSPLIVEQEIDRYPNTINYVFNNRIRVIQAAMADIKPLGHGYSVFYYTFWTVHNVPLVIVDQIGIAAALAWLWITIYCLVKYKWKYAFVAVIALSLFDHFIWTQMAPYWWVLVGVASTSEIKNDYIFKKV